MGFINIIINKEGTREEAEELLTSAKTLGQDLNISCTYQENIEVN